jgi:transposase-like protein
MRGSSEARRFRSFKTDANRNAPIDDCRDRRRYRKNEKRPRKPSRSRATPLVRPAPPATAQWRKVADQLRPKLPKLAAFMDEAEADVLACMSFPKEHWPKIHSTNGLERLNGEIKRRTEVVGIFPNEDAIVRPVGAILLEQNDEWTVQRSRYMTLETIAALSDDPVVGLPAMAI